MNVDVMTPTSVLVSESAVKVRVEAVGGSYSVLPAHIDFVALLEPGIIELHMASQEQKLIASDQGVMVKRGAEVKISLHNGLLGERLGELQKTVEQHYRSLSDREQKNRMALARLERDMARTIYDFEQPRHTGA
ncbi:MAG: F0F1 ATP synthase subunit epsilon [Chitinivibrionales bacterium]|nr:F0F1 ATP synthase subunit epsilon [Chitinivibrionales bacterium]